MGDKKTWAKHVSGVTEKFEKEQESRIKPSGFYFKPKRTRPAKSIKSVKKRKR